MTPNLTPEYANTVLTVQQWTRLLLLTVVRKLWLRTHKTS